MWNPCQRARQSCRLNIPIKQDYLKDADKNLLYKKFGLRVTGKQNLQTFEMDRNSLTFVDLFDCDMEYSDAYLDGLMKKAAPAWENVPDANQWLDEIRGGAHV